MNSPSVDYRDNPVLYLFHGHDEVRGWLVYLENIESSSYGSLVDLELA